MCYVCNPYCGKCRPPKPRPRVCAECGWVNEEPEAVNCGRCGIDLPAYVPPTPKHCLLINKVCANPCGKADMTPRTQGICRLHTPIAA